MTLYTLVNILKQIALVQPNVRMATDGSIYDKLNATNSVKYDVVHFSQTKHIEDEETDTYGFNIFYVSRLEDSLEDNRLQIQSIGKEVLGNILRSFCENWSIDFPEIIYYPFTQKFADLCAGVYCRVEIEVPKEIICADDYIEEVAPSKGIKLENILVEIDQNGTREVTPSPGFDGIGKVTIVTEVTGGSCNLEYKEVEYTQNGDYTILPSSGYDGLSEVAVTISVPQGQGYEEGYADGVADQKAKLSSTSFTQNSAYTRADGWSAITVNVPQGQGYEEGYADGEAAQKAKLTVTSLTENNTYTREDGWSAVTVNVDDRYDEGYADGYAAGASACSGYFITALTLNVDSAITNYGTATTTYSPNSAFTDIYYTSSDLSIATIDSGTGEITVIRNGTVTICAQDSITHLQDCKQITVTYDDTDYLTFEILTGGTIKVNERNVYHMINGGEWVSGTSFNVSEGDIIKFRIIGKETGGLGLFSGTTAYFNVSGNAATICTHPERHNFAYMFRETNVVSAKHLILPVTSWVSQYQRMFIDCTHLVEAPELPATNLPVGCYEGMFWGCTSLTTAPVLPATTLASTCYANMFRDCTSLTIAPVLPATTLAGSCYSGMFYGCTSLNYIKCLATDISESNCTHYWVSGVSSTGTFIKNPSMTGWTTGINGIPSGWTVISDYSQPLTFNIISGGTIYWKTPSSQKTIQYSLDNGTTWTSITSTDSGSTFNVNAGDKVMFRGDNATYDRSVFCGTTAVFEVEGNIMSLIDSTGYTTATTLTNQDTFRNIFYNCSGLTSAENLVLPATTLAINCYNQMFYGCTSLTTAPELPATTLANNSYYRMFCGCTSLTTAPELPATTLATSCYSEMFRGCTSLTTAPQLPATTLADWCYYIMFSGCTSLTTAPELPAITLAQSCYSVMFGGCTGLTTAPELPATTLAQSCYNGMFRGCTNLNYIKCLATDISADGCTYDWVNRVASTGTFVKNANMSSWETGTDGIPTGWTIIDNS